MLPASQISSFLVKANGAGMVELGAQLALVDDLGKANVLAAIDDRKGDALIRIKLADHLQHQKLVKIGIEQAAHDRVEPPAMIIGSGCDIGNCHGGTLPRRGPPSQWVLAAAWQLSALFLPDSADSGRDIGPEQAYPGQIAA